MMRLGNSGASGRGPLLPILLGSVLLIAGLFVAGTQLGISVARLLLGGTALTVLGFTIARWRASVYIFMVYVVVEGFILNYFSTIPELNLLKDGFVLALFAVLAIATVTRRIFPMPWATWLMPFVFFSMIYLMQIFNPKLPNILVGLVGARVMLLYTLVVPVAYWFFDTRERVIRFFLFLVLLSIPISLFGIFQYFAGPSWLVSLSPGFLRTLTFAIGDSAKGEALYFRTISTFVSTGSFSHYLWFMMIVTVALFNMASLRAHRIWIVFAFAAQFLAQLTSGGRSAFVYFIFSVPIMLMMRGKTVRLIPAVALAVVVFALGVNLLGPVIENRFRTVVDWQLVRERNTPLGVGWLLTAMSSDTMGYGAGYATIASRHAGITDLNQKPVENMLARVRFEAGLIGFISYMIFILAAIVECVRVPLRLRDPDVAWPATACAAYILANLTVSLPFGTPFDISPNNVFIWFFLGMLARVPQLSVARMREPLRAPSIATTAPEPSIQSPRPA